MNLVLSIKVTIAPIPFIRRFKYGRTAVTKYLTNVVSSAAVQVVYRLRLGHNSDIIYLSGRTPFTLSIDIARPRGHARQHSEAHSSFIDVVIEGSVLDVSSALQTGQLSLVESEGDYPRTR